MADDPFAREDIELARPSRGDTTRQPRELSGRMVLVGLIGFFGVVFAVNGLMIEKALSTFGGVETESSYEAGQLFEHEVALARAQNAEHWRVDAKVTPSADGGTRVDIVARDAAGAALTGIDAAVTFERPTDRRLDRALALDEVAPGHFRGGAEKISAGQWDLVIELSRQGRRHFRSRNRIVLQ